jgi:hypothetical protein
LSAEWPYIFPISRMTVIVVDFWVVSSAALQVSPAG